MADVLTVGRQRGWAPERIHEEKRAEDAGMPSLGELEPPESWDTGGSPHAGGATAVTALEIY